MAFISKSTIQEVNNRLDAVSVVQDYISLEKKSGRWWGRCPFHAGGQEKTPSFKVDPDTKLYHCFGCGKGGSIISFVMEMDKLTYPEAIKTLAKKLGIEIVYEDGGTGEAEPDNTVKEQLYELYRRCAGTFQFFLKEKAEGKPALNYLTDRGISKETIERFKLGFSPPARDFLYKFLQSKGYSVEFLEKSGLFSSRYKAIPLFSGRLMFPISDRQGRVTAFGGRVMPGVLQSDGREPPKYINSPETEIYKKGQTLYALDLALPLIRQQKTVYLAEGYMDVIALHQSGVTNAVAPLGTSFTDEQAALLRRWAEKIILVLDTDEAGVKAAYKAILTCRKNGLSCALINMPEAFKTEIPLSDGVKEKVEKLKDPADILQKFGENLLKKVMNYTINDFEYLISRGVKMFKDGSNGMFNANAGGKNRAAEYMFPYLDALDSEVERDGCIAQIADAIGVDRAAVQKDYGRKKTEPRRNLRTLSSAEERNDGLENKPIRMNNELFLLTVVAVNMSLYSEFRTALEIKEIDDPFAKELFIAMEECFMYEESDIDSLLSRIKNDALRNFIASRGATEEFSSANPRRLMEDGINEIIKKRLRKRLTEIGAEMRNNERAAGALDSGSINIEELLAEKKNIDSQLHKLEGK